MTQAQLLEFLSECAKRGIVVTLNMSVNITEDRHSVTVDDDSPVAPPDKPDFSYYYGNWGAK